MRISIILLVLLAAALSVRWRVMAQKEVEQHSPWKSKKDSGTRPSATRDGRTITLKPTGASFKVPKDWVEWYDEFKNNFHLTHKQLDAVAKGAGEWDTEYASVCNAVLPIDRCAAHVGGDGWGKESVSFADLQVRVYELGDTPEAIERAIKEKGEADVKRFSGKPAKVERDLKQKWRRTVLSYPRFYIDYGATAHVEFRLQRFDKRTFAFVFMYTNYKEQEKAISAMLDSFEKK